MITLRSFGMCLACMCLIASMLGCATTQSLTSQQHFSDQTITAKVKDALSRDPSLIKFAIQVRTLKGEVVLEGNVASIEDVYKAAAIVNHVDGVTSLFNDLVVK